MARLPVDTDELAALSIASTHKRTQICIIANMSTTMYIVNIYLCT